MKTKPKQKEYSKEQLRWIASDIVGAMANGDVDKAVRILEELMDSRN